MGTQRLEDDDETKTWAAKFIQRRWRRKVNRRFAQNKQRPLHHLRSKRVEAPTYLGESCLWVPIGLWDIAEPPVHFYNVRCEDRTQLIQILRSDIKLIIDRFAPWLEKRFENFRRDVVQGMVTAEQASVEPSGTEGPTR